jgi:hypothetical protein
VIEARLTSSTSMDDLTSTRNDGIKGREAADPGDELEKRVLGA